MRRRQQQLDCAICVFLFSIRNKYFVMEVRDSQGGTEIYFVGYGQASCIVMKVTLL